MILITIITARFLSCLTIYKFGSTERAYPSSISIPLLPSVVLVSLSFHLTPPHPTHLRIVNIYPLALVLLLLTRLRIYPQSAPHFIPSLVTCSDMTYPILTPKITHAHLHSPLVTHTTA